MHRVNARTQPSANYTVCAVVSKSLRPQLKMWSRQASYIFHSYLHSFCLSSIYSSKMFQSDVKNICIYSRWVLCQPACSSSLTIYNSCCVARCRLLFHGCDVCECLCVYMWFAMNKWLLEPYGGAQDKKGLGSTALVFVIDCISLFPSSKGHFVSFISVHCSSVFSVSQKTIAILSVILFKLAFKWCGVDSCIQCGKWSLKHSSGASLSPALDRSKFSP